MSLISKNESNLLTYDLIGSLCLRRIPKYLYNDIKTTYNIYRDLIIDIAKL